VTEGMYLENLGVNIITCKHQFNL